ncbi:hypothetical protein EVAR_13966_1 [Eumeta japonica]|uniref:Uncharacterized protein n=1 Tax=Eumeta variegata TaxID=151549 RepID=A0A4C1U8I1_EUMVA|nr:hypothetical protein EVAR_13966_1 [Eumeta japonica]
MWRMRRETVGGRAAGRGRRRGGLSGRGRRRVVVRERARLSSPPAERPGQSGTVIEALYCSWRVVVGSWRARGAGAAAAAGPATSKRCSGGHVPRPRRTRRRSGCGAGRACSALLVSGALSDLKTLPRGIIAAYGSRRFSSVDGFVRFTGYEIT